MADTIDSISIELTASTESAENSIQRVIDMLRMLKAATIDASTESRIVKSIRSIAKAAKEVDSDAGQKLARLAGGLKALSKVGDLSNLADAGKNVASIIRAVGGISSNAGDGLDDLARGIGRTKDALNGLKDADTSKLRAIRDTLSGEMSGPLHTSERVSESAELGGMGTPEPKFGNMAVYGAMTVFTHVADSIRDATSAYQSFQAALGSGVPPIFTEFVDGAMTVFTRVADSIRDVTRAIRQLKGETNGWTWGNENAGFDWASAWAARQPKALNAGQDFTFGGNGMDKSGAIEYDLRDLGESADYAAERFANFRMKPLADEANEAVAAFSRFISILLNVDNAADEAANKIGNLRDALGSIGGYIANDIKTVFSNIKKGFSGFVSSIFRIARYRLIRTMLRTISEGFTEGRKNLYEWSNAVDGHFAASMDKLATSTLYLKNSLGTLVGPLMEALEPALSRIIDILVDVINMFNMFVAVISGRSTYTAAIRTATTWGDAVGSAAGSAAGAVGKAVEEMKRTILGFDEINQLTEKSDSSTGSGHGGGSGGRTENTSVMFEERPINTFFQGFSNALELALQDTLSRITLIVGGAELAIGALLAFSGANIPLGIALIASGAVTMGSAIFANWQGIPDEIKLVVGAIEAALGGGLAVGAVLAFSSGHIGLGIGLMAAALSLEWGAVTVVWTTLKDKIGGQIRAIEVLVGSALFGIGAVLMFASHPEIGIPMMIAGASVAPVAINWDFLKEKLQGPIGAVTRLFTGAALIALGILAILGTHIPLGIGLIIAGATSLVSVVAANWDNLTAFFEDLWDKFKTAAENTWETLKEIGAGIWDKVKEGITDAVTGVGSWIKNHIFKPFVSAWKRLFGGGEEAQTNISIGVVSNANDSVAKMDQSQASELRKLGKQMGDAIRQGVVDKMKTAGQAAWEALVNNWNEQGDKTLDVKINAVKGDWSAVQDIRGLSASVSVNLTRGWNGNALNYLNLANLSTTVLVDLRKAWTIAAINYLNLANLSTTVLVDLRKAWTIAAISYLNLANLSTNVQVNLTHGWAGTALAALGLNNLETTVNVKLNRSGWTNVTQYLSDNFGGATGGGGQTAGGGAGRNSQYKVDVGLNGPSDSEVSGFWGRLSTAWAAGVTAVDKGLDVVVRPVANKSGSILSTIFNKIGSWLFGTDNTPETTTNVKAVAGTGFSSVGGDGKMNLTGINDTDATINLKAGNFSEGYKKWLTGDYWGNLHSTVYLENGNFSEGYKKWVTGDYWGDLDSYVYLRNGNFSEGYKKWVTGDYWGDLNSYVYLQNGNFSEGYKKWVTGDSWGDLNSTVYLQNGNFSEGYKKWVTGNYWGDLNSTVYLQNGNFSEGYKKWVTGNYWGDLNSTVYLSAGNFTSLSSWLGDSVTVRVNLARGGGVVNSHGYTASFASGGAISNGIARHFSNIPHYAGGSSNAHGTLFVAGEAGPEIVGHIGGRTEILNKSQLAQTMFAAVRSAMDGVSIAATFYNGGSFGGEDDYESVVQAMYEAYMMAMEQSNERDREKVALLRQISEKEYSAEISTSGINRAQQRANRRAGVTVSPVGT